MSADLLQDYLTKAEFSKAMHKTPRTINRWHEQGFGPPRVIIGNQTFYKRESVLAWLEMRETQPQRQTKIQRRRRRT